MNDRTPTDLIPTGSIRVATASDLETIRAIYNEAVAERTATSDTISASIEDRRAWFTQFGADFPIFVGISGGAVVSYGCLLRYSPKDGYRFTAENSLYVARTHRGQGWGGRMLAHLLEEAKRIGFRHVCARIFAHNPVSLKLHERAGFTRVGVQHEVSKLDDRWVDVVILECLLTARAIV